jgi:hypothetical protein
VAFRAAVARAMSAPADAARAPNRWTSGWNQGTPPGHTLGMNAPALPDWQAGGMGGTTPVWGVAVLVCKGPRRPTLLFRKATRQP